MAYTIDAYTHLHNFILIDYKLLLLIKTITLITTYYYLLIKLKSIFICKEKHFYSILNSFCDIIKLYKLRRNLYFQWHCNILILP